MQTFVAEMQTVVVMPVLCSASFINNISVLQLFGSGDALEG